MKFERKCLKSETGRQGGLTWTMFYDTGKKTVHTKPNKLVFIQHM